MRFAKLDDSLELITRIFQLAGIYGLEYKPDVRTVTDFVTGPCTLVLFLETGGILSARLPPPFPQKTNKEVAFVNHWIHLCLRPPKSGWSVFHFIKVDMPPQAAHQLIDGGYNLFSQHSLLKDVTRRSEKYVYNAPVLHGFHTIISTIAPVGKALIVTLIETSLEATFG